MRYHKRRKNLLRNCDYTIATYFPLIDRSLDDQNTFINRYLPSFHRLLENEYKGKYAHICIHVDMDGYNFSDSIMMANRFNKSQLILFIEEFAVFSDTIVSVLLYLYFSVIFLFNLKNIKQQAFYNYNGKTYDIWHLLKRDFFKSFCGTNLMSSIWYILLFKDAAKFLKEKSKILCICEMQWWEKALYIFAKKKKITTIGIQHSIVPEMLLNYFNDRRELGGGDFVRYCPIPDYLATVGRITEKLFIKNGWPQNRVFIWGAQRFEPLNRKARFDTDKKNHFVCAFSIDKRETEELLRLFSEVSLFNIGCKVLLKEHPVAACSRDFRRAYLSIDNRVFKRTNEDLIDIIPHSRGLIVTESSSTFYALASCVPVIIPRFLGKLDCNPLSYLSQVPIYIYSSSELTSVCAEIMKFDLPEVKLEESRNFLKDYLYFPEDEREYLKKINRF